MAQIYAFGDSITYGAWDVTGSGWATKVRQWLDEKQEQDPNFYALFYNLGIPGETTDRAVKRFESETEARFRNGEDYIFIFAWGANDAAFIPSKQEFKVPIERFGENVTSLIEQAKKLSQKMIVLNITPVVEEVTVNPTGKDKSRLNKYIERYNAKISEVCEGKNVTVVDVYSEFIKHELTSIFYEDGLHPNEQGHDIIFSLVRENLQNLIEF